jgi:thiamine-monophosphate kinase
MTTVGELGERGLIQLLIGELGLDLAGDDGAVLPGIPSPVVTVDSYFEGVHFHRWWCPPERLGRRLLEATLSDLAAMGAEPMWLFSAISLPPDVEVEWLLGFYRGLTGRPDCRLAGGETVRGETFGITLTAIGSLEGPPLLRSVAVPGEALFVTGPLGRTLFAPGLLDESRRRALSPIEAEQVRLFLEPSARFDASRMIRAAGCRCAIDISDGLASEAAHIACESAVRVCISPESVPLVPYSAGRPGEAFRAGEDYELLFTARAGCAFPGCSQIGWIEAGEGVFLVHPDGSAEPPGEGYDHFD